MATPHPPKCDPRQYPIPDHILKALKIWSEGVLGGGHIPAFGSFMSAVLENDLAQAVAKADNTNIHLIPAIIYWLFNHAPSACWGSKANVDAWKFMMEKP